MEKGTERWLFSLSAAKHFQFFCRFHAYLQPVLPFRLSRNSLAILSSCQSLVHAVLCALYHLLCRSFGSCVEHRGGRQLIVVCYLYKLLDSALRGMLWGCAACLPAACRVASFSNFMRGYTLVFFLFSCNMCFLSPAVSLRQSVY